MTIFGYIKEKMVNFCLTVEFVKFVSDSANFIQIYRDNLGHVVTWPITLSVI